MDVRRRRNESDRVVQEAKLRDLHRFARDGTPTSVCGARDTEDNDAARRADLLEREPEERG